jgi:NADH-quinone oxidoreductase subunit L
MTRLFSLTFLGQPRFEVAAHHGHASHDSKKDHGHGPIAVHESPYSMVVPLIVLAVLSAIGGFIGVPHFSWLEHWLEPLIPVHEVAAASEGGMEWVLMGLSVAGAVLGGFGALKFYQDLAVVNALTKKFSPVHRLLENKWYIDEIYEAVIIGPIRKLSEILWNVVDVKFIDRIVLSFGRVSIWTGEKARVIQTGAIQVYALALLIGILAIVGYLIYGWV